MRLLIDMNLSPKWADRLTESGFEAVHWSEVGPITADDREIMAYAKANDRVILTHDLDFGAILAATGGNAPSVVQIRTDNLDIATIGEQVVGALSQMAEALAQGALVSMDVARTRIAVLPIAREANG